jgi:protein involved in polysaccharide export with SLBB domain
MEIVSPPSRAGDQIKRGSLVRARQANRSGPMETSVAMKRTIFLLVLLLAVPAFTAGQAQTREQTANDPTTGSPAVRDRVVGSTHAANHVAKQKPNDQARDKKPSNSVNPNTTGPKWGNTAVISRSDPKERIVLPANSPDRQPPADQGRQPAKKLIQQTSLAPALTGNSPVAGNTPSPKSLNPRSPAPTVVYHVGAGDVLDIRLTNLPTKESTFFTVLKNGLLEYPLLSGPVSVAGLTTDEIARLLSDEIKVLKAARVSVSVRDFASHAVVVTGLVDSPGRKTMRREAMPLFAVLAESLPRPEASLATIVRGGNSQTASLSNDSAMATLVLPGDVINVSGGNRPATRFVYVGGDIPSRGEKEFRDGMTLTQAILSAGGGTRGSKTSVRVARRDANGFLKSSDYNLQSIQEGKSQDPLLEAGDRIEVIRSM